MGKQKTKPREVEGPVPQAITAPTMAIQMTPKQLSARLSKAKTDAEVESALTSTLNYINSLSHEMSDKEHKENRRLLQQLILVRNAQVEKELQPKLADECIERLNELLIAPYSVEEGTKAAVPAAQADKTEIPLEFQQFGLFQLADIASQGSVGFGNLPSQQAQQFHTDADREAALTALNKLANAYFSGGDTKKAGKEYLKFLENYFQGQGYSGSEVQDAVLNVLAEDPAVAAQVLDSLKDGSYGNFFEGHEEASFSEWQRSSTNNYLEWNSKETTLILSAEVSKYLVRWRNGEFGVALEGNAYKETTHTVRQGEPGYFDRTEKSKYLPGGQADLYVEGGRGRWKAGARVGAQYVPGEQGGWFVPVEAYGQMSAGTDETTQTIRLQVKANPEVTGRILNLEAGVIWNALFFQKGDTAVGYVFGVKGARMSVDANGITWVDLIVEGQLGPTFQKIFREKGVMLWTGVAGIVQQEMPQQGIGAEGPLEQRTKVGAGIQAGIKGEKVEGFVQIQLNPIPVTEAYDFTGRQEQGEFQGFGVSVGIKF